MHGAATVLNSGRITEGIDRPALDCLLQEPHRARKTKSLPKAGIQPESCPPREFCFTVLMRGSSTEANREDDLLPLAQSLGDLQKLGPSRCRRASSAAPRRRGRALAPLEAVDDLHGFHRDDQRVLDCDRCRSPPWPTSTAGCRSVSPPTGLARGNVAGSRPTPSGSGSERE